MEVIVEPFHYSRVTGLYPLWSKFAIYYAVVFVLHFIGEIMTVGCMGVFMNSRIANSTITLILTASLLFASGLLRYEIKKVFILGTCTLCAFKNIIAKYFRTLLAIVELCNVKLGLLLKLKSSWLLTNLITLACNSFGYGGCVNLLI